MVVKATDAKDQPVSHSQPHVKAGKQFRVNLKDGNVQAIDDCVVQGKLFRLVDWADRIELDNTLSQREKEVALMFFAHRCQPDLPPSDPVPLSSLNLDGAVYGNCEGHPTQEVIVVREVELVETEQTPVSA